MRPGIGIAQIVDQELPQFGRNPGRKGQIVGKAQMVFMCLARFFAPIRENALSGGGDMGLLI